MEEEKEVSKQVKITFKPGAPIEMLEGDEQVNESTPKQGAICRAVGKCLKAYRDSAQTLLANKYPHLRDAAPRHLANPGRIYAFCCTDGVVVRFEQRQGNDIKVFSGWMQGSLSDIVPMVSGGFVFCPKDRASFDPGEMGINLTFNRSTPGGATDEILKIKFCIVTSFESPKTGLPQPPNKPYCPASIHNNFDIYMRGQLLSDPESRSGGREFLARSRVVLPVGWDCIEVFPAVHPDHWNPENAPVWAETDLLASVARQHVQERSFHAIDPNSQARQQFGQVLRAFGELLDSSSKEEALQKFLEENLHILCPTHTKCWPKLALGDSVTDFVFRDAVGEYILVELERADHRLFRQDGQQTQELTHAIDQTLNWKRYVRDNLTTVQKELGLEGITANPFSLVVIGRSSSLTPENRTKLGLIREENPRLKVLTYDDLLEGTKSAIANLLGPLWETDPMTEVIYLPRSGGTLPEIPA